MKLNRAARRKQAQKIATHVIKGREVALQKKNYGIGLVITTQLCAIFFWRWVWTPWDKRANP